MLGENLSFRNIASHKSCLNCACRGFLFQNSTSHVPPPFPLPSQPCRLDAYEFPQWEAGEPSSLSLRRTLAYLMARPYVNNRSFGPVSAPFLLPQWAPLVLPFLSFDIIAIIYLGNKLHKEKCIYIFLYAIISNPFCAPPQMPDYIRLTHTDRTKSIANLGNERPFATTTHSELICIVNCSITHGKAG